jgi:hypothetical protein
LARQEDNIGVEKRQMLDLNQILEAKSGIEVEEKI